MAVLLACARQQLQPEDAARIDAAVRRGLNWDRLTKLAHGHGLLPLLHRHAAAGALPAPTTSLLVLKSRTDAVARRALRLTATLIEVIDVCADAAIALAPLKGPVLAQQLYGALSMRQTRDLDLLVRHADMPRLVRLLHERGWRLRNRDHPELDALTVHDLHHVSVTHPRHRFQVEIHYWLLRPRGRRRHGFDDIAARLRPLTLFGRQVQVLDDEALLVYLCEHGAGHTWSRLEWLAGVSELGRRIDPTRAAGSDFARALGTSRRIHAAMDLASRLLGSEPETAGRPFIATRMVTRRLQREPARVIESSAERFFYGLITDPSAAAVARRCWTMLLAPSIGDQRAVPLPRWLRPLHWALRPFRLIARRLGARRA